jgi:RNA polymerase sigma-70 factor (ECF subfamily)
MSGQKELNRISGPLERNQESLAARLKKGEHRAAVELIDKYYKQIYLYLRRLGHSRQTSEDLTQESFLAAWQHTEQLKDNDALRAWLYRIATNTSRQHWRKNKAAVSIEEFELFERNPTEDEKADMDDELEQLKNAVAKLSLKLRQAVVLHYMQRLSIAEAAQAINIRQGTLKSRLNRAIKTLREEIS